MKNKNEEMDVIKRALLLMKYDTKKTLTENVESVETINEQTAWGGPAGKIPKGFKFATTAATGLRAAPAALGTMLGIGATGGAAVIGGAAALALVPIAMWYLDKDNAKGKVEKMLNYCTTMSADIKKVPNGLSSQEIRNLSDRLFDALEGAGTNEDEVAAVFNSLKTVSDICSLNDTFNADQSEDLLEWLDSDIDATDEWNTIYRPMRNIIEEWLLTLKDENPVPTTTGDTSTSGHTGGGTKWKNCTGTYTMGCKSDVIAKVQGCLNISDDGKFGKQTNAALKAKGFMNGFKDSDVSKLCSQTNPVEPTVDEPIADDDINSLN